ncbi:phosphoadenosine phosphosulfate reductase family protein [bacterium]|nr:phosphoadenosine phosphosulfate reductase family protein [bacterium]
MYSYTWDKETGGLLLNSTNLVFSKEPRPVYYKELDILGFDKYWTYEKDDTYPYMWAEAGNYIYKGRLIAKINGGNIYNAPKIEIIEDPEPNNKSLEFVDVEKMVEKNKDFLSALEKDTIKKVYNKYKEYKDRVDVFYVAFSGGKDSIVLFDIVQKAIPHNSFYTIFANTDMEFPTTIDEVAKISDFCKNHDIEFIEAKSHLSSDESWQLFGPPARKVRWCCTVHKTAPVINKLSEILNNKKVKSVMITGVRRDESQARSAYKDFSVGEKLPGQYSFHPILEWNSAELYLYIYKYNLSINYAYKCGFNRVGCIMCPNSSEKHEYIKINCFKDLTNKYIDKIISTSSKDLSGDNAKKFIECGGWKTRYSGRELNFTTFDKYSYEETKDFHIFTIQSLKNTWKEWYKTIGDIQIFTETNCILEYKNEYRKCYITVENEDTIFKIENFGRTKNTIEFISLFKAILAKSQYCINCGTCIAECPNKNISMTKTTVSISNNCTRCHLCLKILNGCLYYNSIKRRDTMNIAKGIDRYLSVGVNYNWIREYMKEFLYEPGNRKTDSMFTFLNDAGITQKRKITDFGQFIKNQGIDNEKIWALLLCNLAYSPAFHWYIKNITFDNKFDENSLSYQLGEDVSKKVKNDFWNGFKIILTTNEYFQKIGFGIPDVDIKQLSSGDKRIKMNSLTRHSWLNPDPIVILYALYKFAENCGQYYQFTLSRLLDHNTDSNGISPTEIFGIDRDTMEKLLQGLAIQYPEYISVSFTHDLDSIILREDKTSKDILGLF